MYDRALFDRSLIGTDQLATISRTELQQWFRDLRAIAPAARTPDQKRIARLLREVTALHKRLRRPNLKGLP